MLFNSFEFLFIFLPVTLIGGYVLSRLKNKTYVLLWMTFASLLFYGFWNPKYLILIVFSILANYSIGKVLYRLSDPFPRKLLLYFGVTANLGALVYYKYANFFINSVNGAFGTSFHLEAIVLPLGISFFTFQQMSYVIDCYKRSTEEYRFLEYALFVPYFPQLIAGPIMRPDELVPEFHKESAFRFNPVLLLEGITIFAAGLFKKTVLADSLSVHAQRMFGAASLGTNLTFFDSWFGLLAYSFQIYFDFSGYSDMAVGLGRMSGIRVSVNFNSPYKATNVIDFWRRWHITLSRFLRDYLYIPLGGSRKGPVRRYANLFVTMVLGGMWHGAGWNFLIWGALHGTYLCLNHAWQFFRSNLGWPREGAWGRAMARVATFVAVTYAWVFFRAESFDAAVAVTKGLMGMGGFQLPQGFLGLPSFLTDWAASLGVQFIPVGLTHLQPAFYWVLFGGQIAWLLPNTLEWVNYLFHNLPMAHKGSAAPGEPAYSWKMDLRWALFAGILAAFGIMGLTQKSEFLYFQF